MFVEPLAGFRQATARERRTKVARSCANYTRPRGGTRSVRWSDDLRTDGAQRAPWSFWTTWKTQIGPEKNETAC